MPPAVPAPRDPWGPRGEFRRYRARFRRKYRRWRLGLDEDTKAKDGPSSNAPKASFDQAGFPKNLVDQRPDSWGVKPEGGAVNWHAPTSDGKMPSLGSDDAAWERDFRAERHQAIHARLWRWRDISRVRRYIRTRPLPEGVEFKRILSCGGYGVAILFGFHDRQTNTLKQLVLKMDRSLGSSAISGVKKEKEALNWLHGSKHIATEITRQELDAMIRPWDGASVAPQNVGKSRLKYFDFWHQDHLMLPFCNRGEVSRFLRQLKRGEDETSTKVPYAILWSLFACIVRGIGNIAFPPKEHPENDRKSPADWVHDQVHAKPTGLVHFDLDGGNAWLEDMDDAEHGPMPTVKIGDFGVCSLFKPDTTKYDEIIERNRARHRGKMRYLTPEQFTSEWDTLLPTGGLHHPVAGNYGSATNVYQAGLILAEVITLRETPAFPFLERIEKPADGPAYMSYGGRVWAPAHDHLPEELRDVVCRMLAHRPEDRPSIEALLKIAADNVVAWPPGTEQVRTFLHAAYGRPVHAPPPPAPGAGDAGDAGPLAQPPRAELATAVAAAEAARDDLWWRLNGNEPLDRRAAIAGNEARRLGVLCGPWRGRVRAQRLVAKDLQAAGLLMDRTYKEGHLLIEGGDREVFEGKPLVVKAFGCEVRRH